MFGIPKCSTCLCVLECGVATNFNDLLSMLKGEVLADSLIGASFTDSVLLDMLYDSSVEIAGTLGFPQEDASAAVADGDSTIAIDSDLAVLRVNQVRIGAFNLRVGSPSDVLRKAQYLTGRPAVYEFDPRLREPIQFAPPYGGTGATASVRYTIDLSSERESYTGTSEPWLGYFRNWWSIIVLHAGDKAVRSEGDLERASAFQQRYQLRLLEFGEFLGLPPNELGLASLLARRDTAQQIDNPTQRIQMQPQVEERR